MTLSWQTPDDPHADPTWTVSPVSLALGVLLYMLLIGAACTVVFHWTMPTETDYSISVPLRTHPPSPSPR